MAVDFNNPEERLTALIKLRGDLAGAAALWWYKGNQYAVVDREPTLLWQVEGVQLGKYDKQDDGSYDHIFQDIMFYIDPETDEVFKDYENPFTGEMNTAPVMRVGPFTSNVGLEKQTVKLPEGMPPDSLVVDWRYEPVTIQGDDLFMRERGMTKIANFEKDSGKPGQSTKDFFVVNDFFTLVGSVNEVTDPDRMSVSARTNYQSINEWTPWLKMGDAQGAVFGRGNSTKLNDYEELPERLRRLIEAEDSDFFSGSELALWDKAYTPLNQ